MRVCPRHRAVVVEALDGAWRCFICHAAVEPVHVEEPSTLPFGAQPNVGLYDRAIRELVEALKRSPHDERLVQRLAEIHLKRDEPVQAAAYFSRLAGEYEKDGFAIKAVAIYKQVLRLRPDDIETRLHLARLFEQLGLPQDAVAQLEAALLLRAEPEALERARTELERLRRR